MDELKDNGIMNILVTLDSAYIKHLNVMLFSLLDSNTSEQFKIYLLHRSIKDEELDSTRSLLGDRGELFSVKIEEEQLKGAPTTERYPIEIYYRLFAARYLPKDLDRILYLDPDLIVLKPLRDLYDIPMGNNYFAAASHIGKFFHMVNEIRLNMGVNNPYINSGVLLMNLAQLRKSQDIKNVFNYISHYKNKLILPDQDVISGLYGDRIIPLDPFVCNMTERLFALRRPEGVKLDIDFVRKNTAVIHYCGRNKPWKTGYIGKLDIFYNEVISKFKAAQNNISEK